VYFRLWTLFSRGRRARGRAGRASRPDSKSVSSRLFAVDTFYGSPGSFHLTKNNTKVASPAGKIVHMFGRGRFFVFFQSSKHNREIVSRISVWATHSRPYICLNFERGIMSNTQIKFIRVFVFEHTKSCFMIYAVRWIDSRVYIFAIFTRPFSTESSKLGVICDGENDILWNKKK